MTAMVAAPARDARPTMTPLGTARIYALEAKYEFLKLLRLPAFAIPTITFPALFYVIFGLSFRDAARTGGVDMATYLLATYAAFGVMGAALFAFGVGVATERGQGWMLLKRATPMPPAAYFLAKVAMSILFGAIILALLATLGVLFGGVRLPAGAWAQLAATVVLGAIPFCALGLAIGSFVGPNSAAPVVNLVYLPLAFASGMWIPIEGLPTFFQAAAPFLPGYHFAQLTLGAVGYGRGEPPWVHVAALAGFMVAFLAFAFVAYRRDDGRTYG